MSGSAVITNDASKDFPASVGEKFTGNRTYLLGLTENFLLWTEKGLMGGEIRTEYGVSPRL